LGEALKGAAQRVPDCGHGVVVDVHGNEGTFVEVDDEARRGSEHVEDGPKALRGSNVCPEQDEGVVRILEYDGRQSIQNVLRARSTS
jgi:hypothetical protein